MLKHIPKQLSPALVEALMEMGHGDEILLADANYPARTNNARVIRADGLTIPTLLQGILTLMPLDPYADYQAVVQAVVPGDKNVPEGEPPVWHDYRAELAKAFPGFHLKSLERFDFYDHSKQCFAIVQTGEQALYGNLILKKGVIA
ncbi:MULTISPECIES: RbsD/FucU family protein [Lacticaseibacillus]|uniref:Fucose operon protein n=1 Tax=Lacticaseibacillus casei DSM 20011 = JCM 1134 = ATCC 393 TaxID=1423732 RepID=A0AAD1ETR6_LACCA|nr:RbsD/FucU domain-containing protein [Lacticaseibacillus casei]HAJ54316.1 fucose isomerase [Lactobacillus sp.]MBI6598257.1 fucose isomerase [Lacticaseibacillus casei]MBO1481889.1 fucose isomerase [Lacticaseibacillus casei]MBO2417169.1 fucose isomerase [Lacticaseibacillus casei]MCK2081557.1 fucose isomerase [Lacticaseibacillus casei]